MCYNFSIELLIAEQQLTTINEWLNLKNILNMLINIDKQTFYCIFQTGLETLLKIKWAVYHNFYS